MMATSRCTNYVYACLGSIPESRSTVVLDDITGRYTIYPLRCLFQALVKHDLQQEMFYHSVDGGPFVIEAGPLPLRCKGGMSSMEIGQFPTRSRGIVQTFLHTEGTSDVARIATQCSSWNMKGTEKMHLIFAAKLKRGLCRTHSLNQQYLKCRSSGVMYVIFELRGDGHLTLEVVGVEQRTVIDRAATLPPQIKKYPPVAQRVRRDEGAKSPIQLHGKEHHLIDEAHRRDRNFCYLPEERCISNTLSNGVCSTYINKFETGDIHTTMEYLFRLLIPQGNARVVLGMSEAIQGHALIASLRMASFCLLPRTLASLGRVQELKYGTWHEMRYKEFISDSQFKLFPQTEAVWNTVPQECLSSEKAILRQHDSDQQCILHTDAYTKIMKNILLQQRLICQTYYAHPRHIAELGRTTDVDLGFNGLDRFSGRRLIRAISEYLSPEMGMAVSWSCLTTFRLCSIIFNSGPVPIVTDRVTTLVSGTGFTGVLLVANKAMPPKFHRDLACVSCVTTPYLFQSLTS
ncbi:Uncharacterized protein LW93_1839 [Fusarium fujikuroi]|nr:Uncharacterized protein LW93_1839 [Fusarium fujikuroi]